MRSANKGYKDEKHLSLDLGCIPNAFSGSRGLTEDGQCSHWKLQTKHTHKASIAISLRDVLSLMRHSINRIPVFALELQPLAAQGVTLVCIPLEHLDDFVESYKAHKVECMPEIGGDCLSLK